jgi:serralysin
MSVRSRSTIASNSALIDKSTSWTCLINENMFKSLLEPFSFSNSNMAAADAALLVPSTISVPDEVLLTDTISPSGDFDLFGINLIAGRTYLFSVYGSGTTPLVDSIVALFDGSLTTLLAFDDDGGSGRNALLTYTATFTGLHVIDVEAFPGLGLTGQYTLDVVLKPLADVVDSTFENAPLISPGVTYGFIDSPVPDVYGFAGETDTYSIEMEAGQFYFIEVAGGADSTSNFLALPPGELDPRIFLYDEEGNLVAQNDDISFPSDISSRIGFLAEESGTYFLDVQSYAPWTGGFSITLQELDLADFSPLDAINWFSADSIDVGPGNVVKVYFATPGESFGELADNGVDPLPSFGWNAWEKQQVFDALLEFTKITGITYVETSNAADAEFRIITTTSEDYGAYFYPQDPAFGTAEGIGAFNVDSGGWNFDQQQSLVQGGYAFSVILHEFGHAHGLAHPHDDGGGSDILLGVSGPFLSYGVFDLNQGVYTVMSYNDAWDLHPDGPSPFTGPGIDNGWTGTLNAFDIAVLQSRYGVHAYATGNTLYQLDDATAQGTYYETIWDTGGTDEIRYGGNRNAHIDLTAATLDYTPTGGGVVSFVDDIKGGFTIANGVVIENATSGGGDDILIGNAAANVLSAGGGDDFLMGRAGADRLNGDSGFDTASYRLSSAGVSISLTGGVGSGGEAAGDRLNGIESLEGSEFNDTLGGGNGDDTLSGLGGNDNLAGGNGQDTLVGCDGDDALDGGNHQDELSGGNGNDSLAGGNHDDVLNGGAGNDLLDGGQHGDRLNGGAGNDVLTGGQHNDVFAFTEIGGNDRIRDFRHGADKIDLSAIDAVAGGGDNAFSFIGASAFSGVAGQLRAFTASGNTFIAGDVNGDGIADFTIQTNILIISSDLVL